MKISTSDDLEQTMLKLKKNFKILSERFLLREKVLVQVLSRRKEVFNKPFL
jgi:hypothetical protein